MRSKAKVRLVERKPGIFDVFIQVRRMKASKVGDYKCLSMADLNMDLGDFQIAGKTRKVRGLLRVWVPLPQRDREKLSLEEANDIILKRSPKLW